jgi:hypothetical protein
MPYWSARISSNNQVVVNKLCILIFKLKKQQISPALQLQNDEIQAVALALKDYNMAEQNMPKIQGQLIRAHYNTQPIRGDGNCGFYAILQALNPDQAYDHVQPNDPQWQAAANLRQRIADGNPNLAHLAQMVTTLLGTEDQQMGFDALPAVAQHLNRPLVVINTTPDADHTMFAHYDQSGTRHGAADFQAALDVDFIASSISLTPDSTLMFDLHAQTQPQQPIVLLHRPGHWEAVLPQNAPPPDTLEPVPLEGRHGCLYDVARFFGFRV